MKELYVCTLAHRIGIFLEANNTKRFLDDLQKITTALNMQITRTTGVSKIYAFQAVICFVIFFFYSCR